MSKSTHWLPAPYALGSLSPLPAPALSSLGAQQEAARLREDRTSDVPRLAYAGLAVIHTADVDTLLADGACIGWSLGDTTELICAGDAGFERFLTRASLAAHYAAVAQRHGASNDWPAAAEAYERAAQATELAATAHACYAGEHWPAALHAAAHMAPADQRARASVLRTHAQQCALAHLAQQKTPAEELAPQMRAISAAYTTIARESAALRGYSEAMAAIWTVQAILASAKPAKAHSDLLVQAAKQAVYVAKAALSPALLETARALQAVATERSERMGPQREDATLEQLADDDYASTVTTTIMDLAPRALPPVTIGTPLDKTLLAAGQAWLLGHPLSPSSGVSSREPTVPAPADILERELNLARLPDAWRPHLPLLRAVALRAVVVERARRWQHGNDVRPGTAAMDELLRMSEAAVLAAPVCHVPN